jgi:hypothetical protein
MVEVLLFVNIGLLVIGSVTLTIAVFVLQKARGYVELAEERMERLREGQERLFQMLREELGSRSEQTTSEEGLAPEPQQRTEEKNAKPEIQELEKELRKLRAYNQSKAYKSGDSLNEPPQNVGLLTEGKSVAGNKDQKVPSTENSNERMPTGLGKETPEGKKTGFAVKHAHPDDDVSLQREGAKQNAPQGSAPVKMFREHYHRYLENYEGYVKLAERLCKMREDGEVPSGSPAESEWEQKLSRLNDGIQRTAARLDILEQYNPELASDEGVSHRAQIAQSYAELEKQLPVSGNF